MKYLLAGLGSVLSATALATVPPDSAKVTRRVEFQDQYHQRLQTAEGAVFRAETITVDSLHSTRRIYYLPSGKLHSSAGLLQHKPYDLWEGDYLEYYENGQLRVQQTYVQGKVQGQRTTYYPTGVLRRREQVLPSQPITGECNGPDGQSISYFPYEVLPEYPGGQEALLRYLAVRLRYPAEALRDGVQGVVFVKFRVAATGQVEDIQPVPSSAKATRRMQRTYGYLQEEAVRVVRMLPPFLPGQLEGEPVAVYYTVPLTFKIK
ncbi:TonB family protein [Hymenobacter sp. UYP22]|uniref:TonB family protein n=1 Tax=Hymenobacter sp. UYP22 TaxID=3156348 RepID=UPI00339253C7